MLVVLLLFLACSDGETVVDPYLKIDLSGETVNFDSKAVEAFDVKLTTNQADWKISTVEANKWCHYQIISEGENVIIRFSIAENEDIEKREAEYILTASGCQPLKFKIVQLGTEHAILFNQSSPRKVTSEGEEFTLIVTSNVSNEPTVEDGEDEWIEVIEQPAVTRAFSDKIFKVVVYQNRSFQDRVGQIKFTATTETTLQEPVVFTITQEKSTMQIEGDIKLKVKSAELKEGNEYPGQDVGKSIDGDYSTIYGSRKIESPEGTYALIEYTLEQPSDIGYVRLVQRPNDDKGSLFASGAISLLADGETEWGEEMAFETTQAAGATVDIKISASQISKVRVRLDRMTPGIDNPNVALAEFECYQYSDNINDILEAQQYFTDGTYSELKSGVTADDIKKIKNGVIYQLAKELLDGTYDKRFRFATYHSCKDPQIVAKELTIGNRSIYDNPTGIFFEKGTPVIAFVSYRGNNTHPLALATADYRDGGERGKTLSLKEGLNIITPVSTGNGYIQYWTEDETKDVDVDIHFCFGKQIGYWDVRRGDTDATWPEVLEIAKNCAKDIPNVMFDILGTHVQLQNTVDDYVSYAPNAIQVVVDMHDKMLYYEYELMGLAKNKAIPNNRFLGVRSWGGNPVWNGTCACFPNAGKAMLTRSKFLSSSLWMYTHEFGHGNQIAQMKGAGWTEVTNNLYGSYAQYMLRDYPESSGYLGVEHESWKRPGAMQSLVGGRINAFINESVIEHKTYFTQQADVPTEDSPVWSYKPLTILVPLWQLTVYFMVTDIKPDFWPDVHWAAIHDNKDRDPGQRYVNFMKRAIDASGMNMCAFFEYMGLLREIDMQIGDYGTYTIKITKEMVDEVKRYAEGKPLVPKGMIYASINSADAFKYKRDVEGTFNFGFTKGDDFITVDHEVWKNVVAFETYNGEKMTDVCIVGTGDIKGKTTRVDYPIGTTRIEAVGWDGKRTLVIGSR